LEFKRKKSEIEKRIRIRMLLVKRVRVYRRKIEKKRSKFYRIGIGMVISFT